MFVELLSALPSGSSECLIELEGPRGKMRIQWKGASAADLAGLIVGGLASAFLTRARLHSLPGERQRPADLRGRPLAPHRGRARRLPHACARALRLDPVAILRKD